MFKDFFRHHHFIDRFHYTFDLVISQHRAYVRRVSERLFPTFDDIEAEADRHTSEEFKRLGERSFSGEEDFDGIGEMFAEMSLDEGLLLYESLVFVKGQFMAIATAGMYHIWEKSLKKLFVEGLRYYIDTDEIIREVQNADFKKLKKLMAPRFDVSHLFSDDLEICQLIANTAKHGDGRSCEELAEKMPRLLAGPYGNEQWPYNSKEAENLWVTHEDFSKYSEAIENFWKAMNEQLRNG